ncbi:MAG TPA: EAL domain-containing protein [Bryobacteraceae bacterium]|nr:EAL domain-containing protein [Bryobacteraceae bacterium]
MNHFTKRALLLVSIAAGLVASILAARALKQAIAGSENLYRVDTAGLQLESALEYETQESRRAFLYALAIQDPNEQLPYIDQARLASERVDEALRGLTALNAPAIGDCIRDLERSWQSYGQARDEIVAHILEGDTPMAVRVERLRGEPAFLAALHDLHELRSTLALLANSQSVQVNSTLRRCAAGLAAFALCTLLTVGLLSKLSRDRQVALERLRASNEALAAETDMEERRAFVLEMVSTHEPLSRTLGTIVELAPKWSAGAGAAVWAAAGADLLFQMAANLPGALTDQLRQHALPRGEECSTLQAELEVARRDVARELGLQATESKALRDAAGRLIGMLQIFVPLGTEAVVRQAVLDQMAQLASVAIENTLLYERLAFQAQHDTLTLLPDRTLFQDRVQQAVGLARRHEKKLAVLWIDLDRYKQVNDTLGHRVGDEVLCEVARRLKGCLRGSDSVARTGGDEFTVLAHDLGSLSDAEDVALKILESLGRPMLLSGHEVAITSSIGISLSPEHGEDPIMLLRNADLAMYNAKRSGGNGFCIYQPGLGHSLEHRIEVERELRNALERHEFSLEYQPMMDRDGRIVVLEALIRWTNPVLGCVSPADFIPIAEEMGLILSIGEWVTHTACQDCGQWLRAGYEVPRIAVNVSSIQLVNKGFGAMVENALRAHRLPARNLELEITETALMNNLDQAMVQIESLRDLGVRFAIDDFGTGYSSLSQLRTLPLDCLKIDRSFIRDLQPAGTGSSTLLVQGIITLAHSLQLDVVAEGVETREQLDMLRSLACDIYQGFLLSRPLPAHAVEALLWQSRRSAVGPQVENTSESAILIPSMA